MELLGEEVGQLWGRRPPYIVGGNNPTVTPHTSPAESGTTAWPAVLPLPLAVLPLGPERYYRGGQGGTTAYEWYYGPHCRG